MKVGIVGDVTRTVAWEKHLRPHGIVHEVNLVTSIKDLNEVDACIILDDSFNNLSILLEAVQYGYHCFLVSKQPTDTKLLEKIHRASKESNVKVQFSHWPTLAPATQWMFNKIQRPQLINITKHINRNTIVSPSTEFKHYWIDELGLCLKWINSGIHHVEAQSVWLNEDIPSSIQLFLRFENGSTSSIHVYTCAHEHFHKRIAFSKTEILECDVPTQNIRIGRLNENNHLFFGKQTFKPSQSAEKAALIFLKSIQLNTETGYSSYDALQLSLQIERIDQRLKMFK